MPVIAIVGAGPGLGLSIARRFGREGFTVALISRSAANLDRLAAELADSGIQAAGFPADVRDRPRCARRWTRPPAASARSTYWSTPPPHTAPSPPAPP
jgi:NAD(P)-dependent dehydrogenase (short-subunit alcohol dehydrogenase family)